MINKKGIIGNGIGVLFFRIAVSLVMFIIVSTIFMFVGYKIKEFQFKKDCLKENNTLEISGSLAERIGLKKECNCACVDFGVYCWEGKYGEKFKFFERK